MKQKTVPSHNFDLADVLDAWKRSIFLDMNCHAVGKVKSFDSKTQIVSVQIVYTKQFTDIEDDSRLSSKIVEKHEKYPILVDCPVMVLKGGGVSLKMPIKSGDECIVLFNDRSIDEWWDSGRNESNLDTNRLHTLTDAIAIVGLSSRPNALSGYSGTQAVLGDGSSSIKVGGGEASISGSSAQVSVGSQVEIKNTAQNLKTILDALADAIQTVGGPGAPIKLLISALLK